MPLERFHITATGHSLNYLPEYIARRHGFFAAQGLAVSVSVPSPWDLVLSDLAGGTADAALGGVWVPSMYHARVRKYTAFAQVANRAPLALVGRSGALEKENWRVRDVAGRTVLMKGSNGASVGLFFKMLLRENGIDPKAVNYVQDLDGVMLGELFVGGLGDYLLVDNLSARALVERNPGLVVVFETAVHGGDVPWSVYYRETLTITPEVLDAHERFCVALGQGMDWVLQHDAEAFRDELAEIFPKVPVQVAVDLTNVFRNNNMWTSPTVDRKGYGRWQKGIADGHLVKEPLTYEDIVDNRPATAAQERQVSPCLAGAKTP
ncbi:periplasmic binding protein-like II [Melanomma pulvis-pyrius CBS 109.77]|uniref:4-amino-5-hydroxymethyl-2-methylpyrimidine phosphate synthase n=1 Tax=Melanomma pulvis-pyrius CBS 109.77 TaxID=1314802 RepID=A0A6A6XT45_9PLEO|nr:periplasmic binding protein-like II [Melanomma pulvis-pyrius CBS 109.77]